MDTQAIVNTMEVLETKPINELVSESIIKVCYVSDDPNPNKTVIDRETGKGIAATLPGAPVAGFFNKEIGDFEEHSRKITFKDGEINVEDITRPYGFVSPTDKPWYQDFMEDGVVRTYLMCKAYLWTRQYEEASLAFNKGQSMELDERKMSGYYQGDVFIFTEVTLDKLCILGDNYAPCFSGAKIMSTYARQFDDLAGQLEKTIGRRYYVMDDQLTIKPDGPITLEYALQLGWNLTDAVWAQLRARGSEEKYSVEGIFVENSEIFVILQERETLEYLRCGLTITNQETVELAAEMVAVKQSWTIKGPSEPESVEPLSGGEAVPEQEIPLNVSATFTAQQPSEDTPTNESTEGNPASTSDNGNFTADPVVDGETPPAETPAEPPAEPPEVDYKLQVETLTGEIANYTATIASLNQKITEHEATIVSLNETIAAYRATETETINTQKDQLFADYNVMLTEEEIKPILDNKETLSVEEIESKLAITYTRKQKNTKPPANQFQVDVNNLPDELANLPEFMKQAMEIDKSNQITLKQ